MDYVVCYGELFMLGTEMKILELCGDLLYWWFTLEFCV